MTDVVRTAAEFLDYLYPNNQSYADPVQTVLQSQLARDLIVSIPSLVSNDSMIVVDGVTYSQDSDGINAAFDAARALGGAITVFLTKGTYTIDSSLDLRGINNITVMGAGINVTVLVVAANSLDAGDHGVPGSAQMVHNDVFNDINGLGADTGNYYTNARFCDFTIDATNQSKAGMASSTDPAGQGINLCGIECQNRHAAVCERVRFKKCYGNGFVSASIDPKYSAAVVGVTFRDNYFEDNCTGPLGTAYNDPTGNPITGCAIQVGAMTGGLISDNKFYRSGGTGVDYFNCRGLVIQNNYFEGVHNPATSTALQTCINGIHSDFGSRACTVVNNYLNQAGNITLVGNMSPNAFNGNVATPGPNETTVDHNHIYSTGTYLWSTQPSVPASGFGNTRTNTSGYPVMVRVSSAVTGVQVNGVAATMTGSFPYEERQVLVPHNQTIAITYAVAPTWEWFVAPNGGTAGVVMTAGNATGLTLGLALHNTITGNTLEEVPYGGFDLYDMQESTIAFNEIFNCGNMQVGNAFSLFATTTVVGAICAYNTFISNHIEDGFDGQNGRTVKKLLVDFSSNSTSNVGNRLINNRVETAVTAVYQLTASTTYIRGDYGPAISTSGAGGVGTVTSAPWVEAPAGTWTYTNPFSHDIAICVGLAGGGITSTSVDGQATGLTAGTFRIGFGGTITVVVSAGNPSYSVFLEL